MAGPAHGLRLQWLRADERPAAADVWRDLEGRVGEVGLACTWDWTGTWLEHYGDVVPHGFAVASAGGAPCGIALLTRGVGRRRGPLNVRSVHLGTAGEPPGESVYVEYNGVLCERARRRTFAAAILNDLHRDPGWDELRFDGLATRDAEDFLSADSGFETRRDVCPTADLRLAARAGGDVLQTMSRATRWKFRRSLRELGDVETEWAATPDAALAVLDELVSLHQGRWAADGQPGAFASERFTAFHRRLIARLCAREAVVLFRARAASGTVGCLYAFLDNGRALLYQTGYAAYEHRQIRPGFVVNLLLMQACFDRGLAEYDFLAGESAYKRQLTTNEREIVWLTHRRPAMRWAALDQLSRLRGTLGLAGKGS